MAGAASGAGVVLTSKSTTSTLGADSATTPSQTSSPSAPSVIEGCIRPSKKVSSEILSVAGKLDIFLPAQTSDLTGVSWTRLE